MDWKNFKPGPVEGLQFFQLIRFGALFVTGILLTKSSLSLSEIGSYEAFLFLSSLVSFFWVNGLIQGLLPLSPPTNQPGRSSHLFNAAFLMTLLALLAGTAVALSSDWPSGETSSQAIPGGPLLVGLFVLFSGPSSLIENIYLLKEEGRKMVWYGLISFALQIVLTAGPALAGWGTAWVFPGLVLSAMIRFVWLIFLLARYSTFRIDPAFIRSHMHLSWPLILSALLAGSTQYYDQALIRAFFSEEVFAIFRYGARELPFVVLLANAFSNAMIPAMAQPDALRQNLETIKRKTLKMSHILFPVTIILLVATPWIFPRLYNPSFRDSATIFNIYLLIITSRLLFPQTILIGMREMKPVLFNLLISVAIHAILGILFLLTWGLPGIAFAAVISNLSEKILLVLSVRKKLRIPLHNYFHLGWWSFYTILTVGTFVIVFLAGF